MHAPPAQRPRRQRFPQAPQFSGSLVTSTSQPSSSSPLQSVKPGLHARPHEMPEQAGAAFGRAGHTFPQPPQLVGVDRLVSQPSTGLALQSAKPGRHALISHPPAALHAALAFGIAHGVQAPAPHPKAGSKSVTHRSPHSFVPGLQREPVLPRTLAASALDAPPSESTPPSCADSVMFASMPGSGALGVSRSVPLSLSRIALHATKLVLTRNSRIPGCPEKKARARIRAPYTAGRPFRTATHGTIVESGRRKSAE